MSRTSEKPSLYLLFNHRLTAVQEADARASLGVGRIIFPPEEVQALWSQVPPDSDDLAPYLAPVFTWVASQGRPGDYLLVQGDFGATGLAVRQAFALGLIPVYSTTSRKAVEEHHPDGTVHVRHTFSHVRFRRYEQ